jgi:predicted MFS family arabinose efflux permease
MADRRGNFKIFALASLFALFAIYLITNLPAVPIIVALLATSSFFIAAGGRNVPATTMVTSVVSPERRGSFMSVRASANEMGLALASFIAGLIVSRNPDGSLANYNRVGYFAIGMSIVAVYLASRLKRKEEPA